MSPEPGAPRRPDYDQALKRLLLRAHDGFLALVAPAMTWRAERSPEPPAVARHADLVWEVERADGWRGILHIELQTKVEADIGARLADYAIRLWHRDQLPLQSVVVFLRKARTVPAAPFVIPGPTGAALWCDFKVVRLWERPQDGVPPLGAEVLGTPHVALWPLASLMADVTVASTLAVAERIVQEPLPEEERGELAGLLVVLAGMRADPSAILDALRRNHMIDDLLKDNGMVQVLMEEGERRMAQVALEGRFGSLSEDVLAALRSADEGMLRGLFAHIATDSFDQVRSRLGLG